MSQVTCNLYWIPEQRPSICLLGIRFKLLLRHAELNAFSPPVDPA